MLTNRFFLLLILLFAQPPLFAQGWQHFFENSEQASDVVATDDGGAAFGAVKNDGNQSNLVLTKVDADGKTQWQKSISGAGNDQNPQVIKTAAGHFLLGGKRFGNSGNATAVLAKISQFGNLVWEKNWQFQGATGVSAMSELSSGNLLVLLESNQNFVLLETTETGDSIKSRVLETTAGWLAKQMQIADNQTVIITFISNSSHPLPPTVRLLRLSFDGQILSDLVLPHLSNYIALPLASLQFVGDSAAVLVHRDSVYFLNDTLGVLLRRRVETPLSLYLTDILPLSEGRFQVVGTHYRFSSPAQNDIYLSLLDSTLAPVWERFLPAPDVLHATQQLAKTDHESFYLTGNFPNKSYLMRFDSLGNVFSNRVKGRVFWDENQNCAPDSSEIGLKNWLLEITHPNGDLFFVKTDSGGYYETALNTGTYLIKPVLPNLAWSAACLPQQSLVFTQLYEEQNIDFPIKTAKDCPFPVLSMSFDHPKACEEKPLKIVLENSGTAVLENAKVLLQLDSLMIFNGANIPFQTLSNNRYSFDLQALAPLEIRAFWVFFTADCSLETGSSVCAEASVLPDSNCLAALTTPFLQSRGFCQNDSVFFQIRNLGAAMQNDLEFIVIEDNIMYRQGQIRLEMGGDTLISVPANGSTWRIEVQQPADLPEWLGGDFSAFSVERCGNISAQDLGFLPQFSHFDDNIFWEKECRTVAENATANIQKSAFPIGWSALHLIAQNTDLEYFIKINNTSGDTVLMLTVRDTLDFENLDIASFQMGASSHFLEYSLDGRGILTLFFPQINLPDSSQNGAASAVWFQFRIAQKKDLPVGTIIENRAAAIFDFSKPKISNLVWHTVGQWLGDTQNRPLTNAKEGFKIYPNPVERELFLTTFEKQNWHLKICDLTGRTVFEDQFWGNIYRKSPLGLWPGVYIVTLSSGSNAPFSKILSVVF